MITIRFFTTLQSDPGDLWPLRHLIRQMMTTFYDNFWSRYSITIFLKLTQYFNLLWQLLIKIFNHNSITIFWWYSISILNHNFEKFNHNFEKIKIFNHNFEKISSSFYTPALGKPLDTKFVVFWTLFKETTNLVTRSLERAGNLFKIVIENLNLFRIVIELFKVVIENWDWISSKNCDWIVMNILIKSCPKSCHHLCDGVFQRSQIHKSL